MNEAKTAKRERAGWKLGTAKEFLGLTVEEAAQIWSRKNGRHGRVCPRPEEGQQDGDEKASVYSGVSRPR